MNEQPVSREAEALDALLDGRPYPPADLEAQDARLAGQIHDLAGSGLPVNTRFYQQLEQKLLVAADRRSRRLSIRWPVLAASLMGGAVLLVLVLLGALILSRLLGQPQPPGIVPGAAPTSTATAAIPLPEASPTLPAATPAVTENAVDTAAPTGELVLQAALPSEPESVPLYYQVQPGEALTAQTAQDMAARLGIEGSVYNYKGESNLPTYTVSDGKRSVLFFGSTTGEFTYSAGYSPAGWEGKEVLPFEQQAQIATQWLSERGLLDFPYQARPCPTDPSCVSFVQALEGGNLYQDNPYDARINVHTNPAGQVEHAIYRRVKAEAAGSLPILPAAQAWEMVRTGQVSPRIFFQTLDFPNQRSLHTWNPVYRPDERADVYGYASTLQPVDPGLPPRVEVGGLAILGSSEAARQIPMRDFLHVWGIYSVDEQGFDWLELQGWEVAPQQDLNFTGMLAPEDGALLFKAEPGEQFALPGLPGDVPEGEKLNVRGVEVSPGVLQWDFLQTYIEGDQNLKIGSLPMPGMPIEPAALTPPLPETGYQPGDRVEVRGELSSSITEYPDGRQELFNFLNVPPQSESDPYWTARLVGEGAAGIETYTNLPVIIQGTYGIEGSEVVITVEQYEPAWPDVRMQAWFGMIDEMTLAGQTVLVLTDDSGQRWVLYSSTRYSQTLADFGWEPGTEIAIEGYPSQEEPTQFGGLPVLVDRAMSLLGHKDLTRETYQSYLDKPQVNPAPSASLTELPGGTIEEVELVYSAHTFQGYFPPEELPRLLLPFWRFSGRLEDGRAFEILALASEDTQIP